MKCLTGATLIFFYYIMPSRKHHITKLIEHLKTNVSKFERDVGVGASTISKAIDRNTALGFGTVRKILDRHPDVSQTWLETGDGEMLLGQEGGDNYNDVIKEGWKNGWEDKDKGTGWDNINSKFKTYSDIEVGCLFVIGISHQSNMASKDVLQALRATTPERVALIMDEVMAVKGEFKKRRRQEA